MHIYTYTYIYIYIYKVCYVYILNSIFFSLHLNTLLNNDSNLQLRWD